MSLLEPSVNIMCSCGLNHRQFRTFSADMWLESRDVPYRNVRGGSDKSLARSGRKQANQTRDLFNTLISPLL
jgi:hypothetical protein